jgi:carboxypeptidase Taq
VVAHYMRFGILAALYSSSFTLKFYRTSLILSSLSFRSQANAYSTTCEMSASSIIASEDVSSKYKALVDKVKDIERLSGIRGLLEWDGQVMMSEGSFPARTDMVSSLTGVIYEKQIDPELGKLLDELSQTDLSGLSSYERANIRDAKRDYDMTVKKSKEMSMKLSELQGKAYPIWVKARQDSDFPHFAPVLSELVALKKETAAVTHPQLSAYDANIDEFERGMKVGLYQDEYADDN